MGAVQRISKETFGLTLKVSSVSGLLLPLKQQKEQRSGEVSFGLVFSFVLEMIKITQYSILLSYKSYRRCCGDNTNKYIPLFKDQKKLLTFCLDYEDKKSEEFAKVLRYPMNPVKHPIVS